MPNSYEHSYQHDLDSIIDASDAVLAIGTEKVDTTTLKDRSLNNNDATIYGAMRASGYFDGGRRFDGLDDYLDCGNDPSLTSSIGTIGFWFKIPETINSSNTEDHVLLSYGRNIITFKDNSWVNNDQIMFRISPSSGLYSFVTTIKDEWIANIWYYIVVNWDGTSQQIYVDGVLDNNISQLYGGGWGTLHIGGNTGGPWLNGSINSFYIYNRALSVKEIKSFFNTLARLPLYSHNFERYPNSDTSLTSVFPYTSGIITSGSFNKTGGLKCTSSGQIIFSNSFEFDGSEYITLTIDDVEYSGTTTVTQGTITATIAQGSNDITIDMGANDVLEDIRIQFRSEV